MSSKNLTKYKKKYSSHPTSDIQEREKQLLSNKSVLLQQSIEIKTLSQKVEKLSVQNHRQKQISQKTIQDINQKIECQQLLILRLEQKLKQKSQKIFHLQLQKTTLQSKFNYFQKLMQNNQQQLKSQTQQYKQNLMEQMQHMQQKIKENQNFINNKQNMSRQINNLRLILHKEKQERKAQIAQKERDKVLALDKIRMQMLEQMKSMRSNFLSLKNGQISSTTKLAIIQNHQLSQQMQFQQKQVQKLMIEHKSALKQLLHFKQQVQIHKQIQQQLARRSNYSQSIIKKLHSQIVDLEQQILQLKNNTIKTNQKISNRQTDQQINKLEQQLKTIQTKNLMIQCQNKQMKNKIQKLSQHLNTFEDKSLQVILLFIRYLDSIQTGVNHPQNKQNIQHTKQSTNYHIYDLKRLINKKTQQWEIHDVKLVVSMVLNRIASELYKINSKWNSKSKPDNKQINKLPRLSRHTTITKAKDIQRPGWILSKSMSIKLAQGQFGKWGNQVHKNSFCHLSRTYKCC